MKIVFVILLAFCLSIVHAQDCTSLAPMKEGVELEYTSYNKKGKDVGGMRLSVKEASANSAVLASELINQKGKVEGNFEYEVKCENGVFYVDMSMFFDSQQLQGFENMEMEMTSKYLEFPTGAKAGDKLPDGSVEAKVMSGDIKIMTISMQITDHTVEARESITTPAGTFDCLKTSYSYNSKFGFIKVSGSATNWMAEDIGSVRSESFDKKGNSAGSQELTMLKGN